MNYVFGILFIIIGFLIVWKSNWMYENFGAIDYAESKMSSWGGTKFFYKLIGIAIIIFSFLFMSGGLVSVLQKIFSPNTPVG